MLMEPERNIANANTGVDFNQRHELEGLLATS